MKSHLLRRCSCHAPNSLQPDSRQYSFRTPGLSSPARSRRGRKRRHRCTSRGLSSPWSLMRTRRCHVGTAAPCSRWRSGTCTLPQVRPPRHCSSTVTHRPTRCTLRESRSPLRSTLCCMRSGTSPRRRCTFLCCCTFSPNTRQCWLHTCSLSTRRCMRTRTH